jgi:O-antigen/teichoic acid export membrane protein
MLKKIINTYVKKNMLIKVASHNSLSVIVRLITGFILSKAIAYFLFPQGMAVTGNLRSFLASAQGVATSGIQNGVIKYTAEYKDHDKSFKKIISTSFFILIFLTFITSGILFLCSNYFSNLIFSNYNYSYVIKVLAFILPLFTLNTFILSIINGLGNYKRVILINTIGYVFNVVIVLFLLWKYNLEGAILAMVIMPSFLLLVTIFWIKEVREIFFKISLKDFSFLYFKGFSSFILMTLFSALTIPIVHILIKNHIITTIGFIEAGYWEAIIKISQYYLMFIMSLFSLYMLPKLSQNQTDEGFRDIVIQFYKTILPIVIIGFIIIYILRYWVVRIALTKEFLPIQDLFFWQLVGDFFKIASFAIAYQMQAKKMLLWYLFGELFYVTWVYLFSIYFIDIFNVRGAVLAHALSYMLYFILMLFIFRRMLFSKEIKIER